MTNSFPVLSTCRQNSRALALKVDFETDWPTWTPPYDPSHFTIVTLGPDSPQASEPRRPGERFGVAEPSGLPEKAREVSHGVPVPFIDLEVGQLRLPRRHVQAEPGVGVAG